MLKLKPIYLFVIFLIPFILLGVLVFFRKERNVESLNTIVVLIAYITLIIWFLSISEALYQKSVITKHKRMWIIVACFLFLVISSLESFFLFTDLYHSEYVIAIAFLIIQSKMFVLGYILIALSIGLKQYELARRPTLEEWLLEVFLFFFYPIGALVIQPRLNKLATESEIK